MNSKWFVFVIIWMVITADESIKYRETEYGDDYGYGSYGYGYGDDYGYGGYGYGYGDDYGYGGSGYGYGTDDYGLEAQAQDIFCAYGGEQVQ